MYVFGEVLDKKKLYSKEILGHETFSVRCMPILRLHKFESETYIPHTHFLTNLSTIYIRNNIHGKDTNNNKTTQ